MSCIDTRVTQLLMTVQGELPNWWLARPAWHERAACRGMGTELFFARHGAILRRAKAVCETCEVRAECLAAALPDPLVQGVWGSTNDGERRALRRGAA